MTWSIAWRVCDSWASCSVVFSVFDIAKLSVASVTLLEDACNTPLEHWYRGSVQHNTESELLSQTHTHTHTHTHTPVCFYQLVKVVPVDIFLYILWRSIKVSCKVFILSPRFVVDIVYFIVATSKARIHALQSTRHIQLVAIQSVRDVTESLTSGLIISRNKWVLVFVLQFFMFLSAVPPPSFPYYGTLEVDWEDKEGRLSMLVRNWRHWGWSLLWDSRGRLGGQGGKTECACEELTTLRVIPTMGL